MTLAVLSWLAMAAYVAHIMEEYTFDWRNWARAVVKLPVEWSDFFVTNAAVVALGIGQAALAPVLPWAPLTYAALMLINAIFFHIWPFVRTRGRFSPGLFTAVVLFLPIGVAVFVVAIRDAAGPPLPIAAVISGALLMAYPVVMLKLRSLPYFDQTTK